ncbi:alcohol dehydrogenase catalytic domain-containing protein [Micromonospora sp. S-DT3-3-22]|uniref:alcohol dehydrogenase catalytic domain-containing protein n=1 Tax=Micromonospora sp. S-DT3-3-22 TaxID=2755359 RepID=UPI0035CBA2F9
MNGSGTPLPPHTSPPRHGPHRTSRAYELTGFGGPEVLRLGDRRDPVPGAHDVVVDVRAVGLDPIDILQRSGTFRFANPVRFPVVPGNEFSGVVSVPGRGGARGWSPSVGSGSRPLPRPARRGTAWNTAAETTAVRAADRNSRVGPSCQDATHLKARNTAGRSR